MRHTHEFDMEDRFEHDEHRREHDRHMPEHDMRPPHRGHHPMDMPPHHGRHSHRPPRLEEMGEEAFEDLGFLVNACSDRIRRRGGRKNSQMRILDILRHYEILPQQRLLDVLHVQPGSLSEIIQKLETKGYVERIRSEEDKRMLYVRITEAGRNAGNEMKKSEDVFSVLSEEEQDTLKTLLKKVLTEKTEKPESEM